MDRGEWPLRDLTQPWTAADFSNDDLRRSWCSYKASIKHLQDIKFTMSIAAQNYVNNLIKGHEERCACLERAQRIINTADAMDRRGERALRVMC